MNEDKTIVTCNEQLLEIISAVEKIKMKEYNRLAKANGIAGCNNIKDFRTREDFASVQQLPVFTTILLTVFIVKYS